MQWREIGHVTFMIPGTKSLGREVSSFQDSTNEIANELLLKTWLRGEGGFGGLLLL